MCNWIQIPLRVFEYDSLLQILRRTEGSKPLNDSSNKNDDRRSDQSRRSELYERSAEEQFLGVGRFSCHSEILHNAVIPSVTDRKIRKNVHDKQYVERRSGRERRCGKDIRSETERFLQGERRSGFDRRELRYRSFKNARVFVRGLKLKSVAEWRNFVKSGMKPDDIPNAPHYVYANDGWAGWGDWLGTNVIAASLSQHRHRFFRKLRALALGLGLMPESKLYANEAAKKPTDVQASPPERAWPRTVRAQFAPIGLSKWKTDKL